jgi:hypothetical protein
MQLPSNGCLFWRHYVTIYLLSTDKEVLGTKASFAGLTDVTRYKVVMSQNVLQHADLLLRNDSESNGVAR